MSCAFLTCRCCRGCCRGNFSFGQFSIARAPYNQCKQKCGKIQTGFESISTLKWRGNVNNIAGEGVCSIIENYYHFMKYVVDSTPLHHRSVSVCRIDATNQITFHFLHFEEINVTLLFWYYHNFLSLPRKSHDGKHSIKLRFMACHFFLHDSFHVPAQE